VNGEVPERCLRNMRGLAFGHSPFTIYHSQFEPEANAECVV